MASRDNGRYLILQVDGSQPNFVYRVQDELIDSQVPRTVGWHTLTLTITEQGSYGVIDGNTLSPLGVNYGLTELGTVSLGRGWGKEGNTYFDNLRVTSLSDLPQSQQVILDSWSDEVYRVYKGTDLSEVINSLNGQRTHGIARNLSDQAMMHFYYYLRDSRLNDLDKAKWLTRIVIDNYSHWGKVWLSPITMNQLAFNVWGMWELLDFNLRSDFLRILSEEANFRAWILKEIQDHPHERTIPAEAGRRTRLTNEDGSPCTPNTLDDNRSIITTNINSNDHLCDTRAEETGATAQLLATAYNMFPNHPNAGRWNEAARCYAFHTLSKGETACDITTRTISNDGLLGNHNLWPNPMYTLGSITPLQQGQFSYLLAGKSPPQEFFHNLNGGLNSQVWQRNLTRCGFTKEGRFEITQECHAGKDWGDRNFLIGALMLAHWAKLDSNQAISQEAEVLFRELLSHFYYLYRGQLWAPIKDPVPKITGNQVHWFKNLEVHAQESVKFFVITNYDNSSFRQRFFPQDLKIYEEDLNNDGRVDNQDLKILLNTWGPSPTIPEADFNSDNIVNGLDFGRLRQASESN